MQDEHIEAERAKFEAWGSSLRINLATLDAHTEYPAGTYADSRTDAAWKAWQARATQESAPADVQPQTPDAGHSLLQRLIDSIAVEGGMACWDYLAMYAVRDALLAPPPATVPASLTDDEVIEGVETIVGMGHGAWDMVAPGELVSAFKVVLSQATGSTQ